MSKAVVALYMHVSEQHKMRLDELKKRTGTSIRSLVEEGIDELARKSNLNPFVSRQNVAPGSFDNELNLEALVKPDPAIPAGQNSGDAQLLSPGTSEESDPNRPVITSFTAWIMESSITPADYENLMRCLHDAGSTHGRFVSKLQQGQLSGELYLWVKDGNGSKLRLANRKALGKFMYTITSMRNGATPEAKAETEVVGVNKAEY